MKVHDAEYHLFAKWLRLLDRIPWNWHLKAFFWFSLFSWLGGKPNIPWFKALFE